MISKRHKSSIAPSTSAMSSTRAGKRSSWFLKSSFILFVISSIFFSHFWIHHMDGVRMRDFLAPYVGARCLRFGCNPYDPSELQQQFAKAGILLDIDFPSWSWEPPVYPPSTIIELVPISFLKYHMARNVWYVASAVLFCTSLWILSGFLGGRYRSWVLLLGALCLTSEPVSQLFNVGQPSSLAISLAIIAIFFFFRDARSWAGILLMAFSLGLKPQLAGLFFLYLLLQARYRRAAMKSAAIAVTFLLTGVLWLSLSPQSRHWFRDYNMQVAQSTSAGAVNDPSPYTGIVASGFTNLQTIFSLLKATPTRCNALAALAGLILIVIWVVLVRKTADTEAAALLALSAISCIGLLPVYHRVYDVAFIMIGFPLLFELVRKYKSLGVAAIACTVGLLVLPAPLYHRWTMFFSEPQVMAFLPSYSMRYELFLLTKPTLLLLLSGLYLVALWRYAGEESGQPHADRVV